ncbi:hypothetical protein Tco_1475961 [Tanacetum coccineum]
MESSDPVDTPMVEKSKLDEDPQRKVVDPTHYVVCICAKKVETMPKSGWTEKDQIDNFLKERRSKIENKGIVLIEMELILEQTQQGISHEVSSAKPKAGTNAATTTTTVVTSPKAKGLVIQEQEQASTVITSSKEKGKGIMVEEPLKMKKKEQCPSDETSEAHKATSLILEEEMIQREDNKKPNDALIA